MKILMLTHYFEGHRGGIEIVAGKLAREWADLGYSPTWLATGAPPADNDISAISLAASNFAERRLGLPYPLLFPSAIARIFREAKHTDAVIVHDGLYLTSLTAFMAARWHGKPVLVVQHIADVPYKNIFLRMLMQLANRLIVRPILARADQCVFISETTARAFNDVVFRTPPKLIFNGVDTEIFSPAFAMGEQQQCRTELGLPLDGCIALFVGRFVEKKGLPVLEHLARLHPDITFAFAGWGPQNPERWTLPNVRVFENLAGATLAPLYQASDVFILPSSGEGFPLVVQEALACGLPVICGAGTKGADPAATDFIHGVPVDSSYVAATASLFSTALMQTLTKKPEDAQRRARANFAAKNYSWKNAASLYMQLMRP
jgi:glycosyltransferase involved in cell wall biosynthesis